MVGELNALRGRVFSFAWNMATTCICVCFMDKTASRRSCLPTNSKKFVAVRSGACKVQLLVAMRRAPSVGVLGAPSGDAVSGEAVKSDNIHHPSGLFQTELC